jgi:hypothetical protein
LPKLAGDPLTTVLKHAKSEPSGAEAFRFAVYLRQGLAAAA